ncbi:MAG: hypothetical protein WDN28_22370 [Chthoniobacter sp.]
MGDLHENVALHSLEQINSPRTQIVYEYSFQQAARSDLHGSKWTNEGVPWASLLNAMAMQQTTSSIQRMLGCLDLLQEDQRAHTYVKQYLVGILLGINAQWIDAISENYSPESLSEPEVARQASGLARCHQPKYPWVA